MRWLRLTRLALFVVVVVASAGCRRVRPLKELTSATAPHISRVYLADGKVVEFNPDLGWYDVKDSVIEGMTIDSQHVEVKLKDIRAVETVREYSLVFVFLVALAPMGAAAYLLYKLFTFL
jgi:hypothetical protein